MTGSAVPLRLRPDLIHRQIELARSNCWVVKDPLSRTYFHFTNDEHAMLQCIDGKRDFVQLFQACCDTVRPNVLTRDGLRDFVLAAQARGLLAAGSSHSMPIGVSERRGGLGNPLAIRLPGIEPDRILRRIEPLTRWLMHPMTGAVAAIFLLAAVFIAASRFDQIAVQAGHLSSGVHAWWIFAVTLSLMKISHELAHAIVCRRLGGECREIGVLLLLGVPCLYCDVSDAWLMPKRWQRVLVSSAGMIVEVVIAAAATCVWYFTIDGPVRTICLAAMVVGSVSTIVFNGNPLMRYDGYYILADWVGIPNLASRSKATVKSLVGRVLFGPTPSWRETEGTGGEFVFQFGYAVASTVYRIAVYTALLVFAYHWASDHGMAVLAKTAIVALVAALLYRFVRQCITGWITDFAGHPTGHLTGLPTGLPTRLRWGMVGFGGLGIIAWLVSIPLPHRVTAPVLVEALDARPVSVATAGRLDQVLVSDGPVRAGDVIAVLRNHDVDQAVLQSESRVRFLESQLKGLRDLRGSEVAGGKRSAGSGIPEVERALQEAAKQHELAKREQDRLTIRATQDGQVFAPEMRSSVGLDDPNSQGWSGVPLSKDHVNAWLDAGTQLAIIGDSNARHVIGYFSQQDVAWVRRDQQVILCLMDRPRNQIRGRVDAIADSPVDHPPQHLLRSGAIDPYRDGLDSPPLYPVRIVLSEQGDGLPIRLTGDVKVSVAPSSVWDRIGRFLSDSFQ